MANTPLKSLTAIKYSKRYLSLKARKFDYTNAIVSIYFQDLELIAFITPIKILKNEKELIKIVRTSLGIKGVRFGK